MSRSVVVALLLAGCATKAPPTAGAAAAAQQPADAAAEVSASASASASTEPGAAEQAAPAPEAVELVDRPLLLWKVERDGAVSHLMGTCHLPIPLESLLPEPHLAELYDARVVVTEADVGGDALEMLRTGWILEGPDLREQIGEDAFRTMAIRLQSVMPASGLVRMRPWLAWSMVGMSELGADATAGGIVDASVAQRASGEGAELAYLETVAQQASLLGDMDADFVTAMRSDSVWSDTARQRDAVVDLCATGSVDAYQALLEDPAYVESMRPLLGRRNEAWMEPLGAHLAEGDAFVAVGAAHMFGDDGLIALLEAEGYQVERLSGLAPERAWTAKAAPPAPPEATADPEAVAAFAEAMGAQMAGGLCVAGQPVHDCFAESTEACRTAVVADTRLCVEQYLTSVPDPEAGVDPALANAIGGCAVTGLMMDALMTGAVPDAPLCQQMKGEVEAAFQPGG